MSLLPQDRQWHIYGLVDPRDGAVRYVGKTTDLVRRLERHINEKPRRPTWKFWWLQALAGLSLSPTVVVLQSGVGDQYREAERAWIGAFWRFQPKLTNMTVGGDGGAGAWCSAETRAKLSAASRGRKVTPDTVERIRASKLGLKQSDATKRKRSEKLTGHAVSSETRAKIAASKVGKPRSAETRAKVSLALTGKRLSDETRAKLCVSQAARRQSEKLERASNAQASR